MTKGRILAVPTAIQSWQQESWFLPGILPLSSMSKHIQEFLV
jgi:hypothetical protein